MGSKADPNPQTGGQCRRTVASFYAARKVILTDIAVLGNLGPVRRSVARGRRRDDGDNLVDLQLARRLDVARCAVHDVAGARERECGGEADEA